MVVAVFPPAVAAFSLFLWVIAGDTTAESLSPWVAAIVAIAPILVMHEATLASLCIALWQRQPRRSAGQEAAAMHVPRRFAGICRVLDGNGMK